MPRYDLLPKNKFDDEAVTQLALLPEAELLPLLPGLAEWIQDCNWPIARDVAQLLRLHLVALVPTIVEVLAGNDAQWQWNMLALVRPDALPALTAPLRAALERIAIFPTTGAYDMHLVWKVRYVLRQYGSHPLLPRSKTDDAALKRLHQLPEAELLPLLPELLEWLEDLNWPVAGPVWDFLRPYVAYLEPAIVEVLMGYDNEWKRHLLRLVEDANLPTLSSPLRELTERIAYQPTASEKAEETDEAARDLLSKYATHLLPQHKGDDEAVARLRQLPETELLPLLSKSLPRLLGCLLDGNWPIAKEINDLLAAHLHQLAPAVWEPALLEALTGPDDIWKGHLLYMLSQSTVSELPHPVRQVVERIAYTSTPSEHEYDTDEAARDLLARFA